MKDLFVTYKIALKLKLLGFNEPCFVTYSTANNDGNGDFAQTDDGSWIRNSEIKYGFTAPLYQQVIDWLRIKHGMLIQENFDGWKVLTEYEGKIIEETYQWVRDDAIISALKLIK